MTILEHCHRSECTQVVDALQRRIKDLEAESKQWNDEFWKERAHGFELKRHIDKLEAALDVALDALIWTTGSGDFGEGGIAHEGALKCLYPAINLLKEVRK